MAALSRFIDHPPCDHADGGSSDFDYVIVGAGAAGCLLANRLSADPKIRVALLEAGGADWNPLIRIPLLAGLLYYLPSLNWGYETEPQPRLANRLIRWPRGRVLGGSTTINGMMTIRGHAQDYDDWAALGLEGWSYDEVLPHFCAFERNESHPGPDASRHGRHGEFFAARAAAANPIYGAWLEAARQAGFQDNDDFNGENQEGVGRFDFNIRSGRRVSAADAFLRPVRRRPNLSVLTRSLVVRLLFAQGRCIGVELADGRRFSARGETILAAGAINSPQLLQLSGVGDAAALKSVGVVPLVDSPEVGANLQDHLGVSVSHHSLKPVTLFGLMRPDRALVAGAQALLFGVGPATSCPLEAGGFLKTDPTLAIPDVHVIASPGLSLSTNRLDQKKHGFTTTAYQLRPQSRGRVAIRSADASSAPLIDPNYLDHPGDRACLRQSLKLIRKILSQPALQPFRGVELSPGPDVQSEAELDAYVQAAGKTVFHPAGTCRMGKDGGAVVGETLKVRGVSALRIADASIMPSLIGGNTSVPTMMIAERCAHLILTGH